MEKLFILVDNQYPVGLQAAQSSHAACQWLLDNKETQSWNNGYIVLLQTGNLKKWMYKLGHKKMNFSSFTEPDVGHKITAIACLTDDYNTFRNLKLMGS